MVDRLIENQTLIDNIVRRNFDTLTPIQSDRIRLAALTPDDWNVLRALHHVLTGFDVATAIVSASLYPTLADAFWAICKLRRIFSMKDNSSGYIELMKKTALNYLNAYINKHLSRD